MTSWVLRQSRVHQRGRRPLDIVLLPGWSNASSFFSWGSCRRSWASLGMDEIPIPKHAILGEWELQYYSWFLDVRAFSSNFAQNNVWWIITSDGHKPLMSCSKTCMFPICVAVGTGSRGLSASSISRRSQPWGRRGRPYERRGCRNDLYQIPWNC